MGSHDFHASARDALLGLELRGEEQHVGPLHQPRVVRGRGSDGQGDVALGAHGTVDKHGDAERLLRAADGELGELQQAVGAGALLHRADVVQPAALACLQPRAGVLLERARRVAVAHGDLALPLRRDHREVGLCGDDGHVQPRVLRRGLGNHDTVREGVLVGPARGIEERVGDRPAERGLGPRCHDVVAEAARRVEHAGADVAVHERPEHRARPVEERLRAQDRLSGFRDAGTAHCRALHGLLERHPLERRRRGHRLDLGDGRHRGERQKGGQPAQAASHARPPRRQGPRLRRPRGVPCRERASGSPRRAPG